MAKYQILIRRSAQKSLKRAFTSDQNRIIQAIRALANDPRPIGAIKLSGRAAWRIRVGVHRVVYEIEDKNLVVIVVTIGHRRDVYRR